jgi:riboflavin kinase/FMN adenylyltransferase
MQHVSDLNSLNLQGCGLTIGSFDGVHRGHHVLIHELVSDVHAAGLPAVVLTFFPHPSVFLRSRSPRFYITNPEEKAALLGELGVDYVITQPFDLELSRVGARDFLNMLKKHLAFRHLWIGEDFALGYRREGSRIFLEQISTEYGFQLHVIEPVMAEGEVVSSTRVREALRAGDVARVASYLGRNFVVPGEVVQGAGRGKGLGFPTANLRIWEERAYPGPGVYACMVELDQKKWKAVTNIGFRPTFEDGQDRVSIETHLLDFDGDLYGEQIEIYFVDRLRDERRFPSPEELLAQIERDIHRTRTVLDK